MSQATHSPCITCAGKGWRWGRTRTDEPGRMAKRNCGVCKGTGKVKIKPEQPQ